MTPREAVILRAVGDVVSKRLRILTDNLRAEIPETQQVNLQPQRIEFPMPQVTNQVEAPVVNVVNEVESPVVNVSIDLAPIALAISEGLRGIEEMLSQLVQVMAAQKPPRVTVEAPNVTVEQPKDRPKRSIKIKHGDGTESVVTEE